MVQDTNVNLVRSAIAADVVVVIIIIIIIIVIVIVIVIGIVPIIRPGPSTHPHLDCASPSLGRYRAAWATAAFSPITTLMKGTEPALPRR
jgi:hypothetical protein